MGILFLIFLRFYTMKNKFAVLLIFFVFIGECCFSQSQGEKLFQENNPKEAVQVLENEILNNQVFANTCNFLGLGYYQLGEYEKSVEAFERGINAQPTNIKILSFNQGNSYFALKQYEKAAECFGIAYKNDKDFYDALLNKANSHLMNDKLVLAKNDYLEYLEKNPESSQKEKIERLIDAITNEIERRKEEQRLLDEQNKARWEVIDPSIDENENNVDVVWEIIDDELDDVDIEEKNADNWQKVMEKNPDGIQSDKTKRPWEEILVENTSSQETESEKKNSSWQEIAEKELDKENYDNQQDVKEEDDNEKENSNNWQDINKDIEDDILSAKDKELYEKTDGLWENLSDEEAKELQKLNIQTQKELEEWEKQQKLLKKRQEQEEYLRKKAKEDEEKQKRQEILEELMKAENEKRQKLLEDVQNSLQKNDSTNISSGAEEIFEYEQEGELD